MSRGGICNQKGFQRCDDKKNGSKKRHPKKTKGPKGTKMQSKKANVAPRTRGQKKRNSGKKMAKKGTVYAPKGTCPWFPARAQGGGEQWGKKLWFVGDGRKRADINHAARSKKRGSEK